ncbi:MAG: hypothetical protein APF82_08590 [Sphingomonadales bacterium BRH_c42]|nr:MAG: hypothetical protein APF82_08590 [Sphingomonadales bacterium BRH_c42]
MRMMFKDPLLDAARILIAIFIAVCCLAAVMLLVGAPALLFFEDRFLAELAEKGVTGTEAALTGAVAMVMVGTAGLLALAVWFMLVLLRIIASVGEGEPFTRENSERLSRMGWIALGGQLASIPVGALVLWIASELKDLAAAHSLRIDADFGIDGEGILLVLILFILARVFRHGAAMREDLEGTV